MESLGNTRLGQVSIKAMGPAQGPHFLALGGLGRRGCGPDWEASGVASHLAAKHRVLLPDPYSNAATAPSAGEFAIVLAARTLGGLWRRPCREEWMLDLLPAPEGGKPVVLAGHSWGGGAAARLAAAHPEAVSRLVLVSPDVEYSVARRCRSIPTLLIWAKNDMVNPYIWTSRWWGHPNLTLYTTQHGGHHVLAEHAEVISRWLDQQDEREAAARGT